MAYITSVQRIGYEDGYEKGKEEGLAQGISQGISQGINQGINQGISQGISQGLREGLLDGIRLGLKLRFGADGLALLPEIGQIQDVAMLRAVHAALETVASTDELRRVYRSG